MKARSLTSLNRTLMKRQLLSERASGRDFVKRISRACCGNNSQDFRESYSSFWARSERFTDRDFNAEFKPGGGLARTWTVRNTVHTFPTEDYYLHVFGSGRRRILGRYERAAKSLGVPPLDKRMRALYHPLMDDIRGTSVTSGYIREFMIEKLNAMGLKGRVMAQRGWSSEPTSGPLWTGMMEMSYLGLLVSAGRTGSESLWMRAADWLKSRPKAPDPEECSTGLVREYISSYGPVTRDDIAYWNNCLLSKEVDTCLDTLRTDLVEEQVEGSKEVHYSFGDGEDAGDPPPVVLLPEFDSLMMGYNDRSRFLERHRLPHVSRPAGIISRTVLLGGFVAGTWGRRSGKHGMTATVSPFRELSGRERHSIEEEFSEYGSYLETKVDVRFNPKLAS